MSPDTPRYVHCLLDALIRGTPLDFEGADVPEDVQDRLIAWVTAKEARRTEQPDAINEAVLFAASALINGMAGEFTFVKASDDTSWMLAALGVLDKSGIRHVGWLATVNERVHHFVTMSDEPEGDGWQPVFTFGN